MRVARRAYSNKSKHAALTLQGLRRRQSPRLGQTPSLCHATPMRQHRTMVATGTIPAVQIQTDKMLLRSHPLWDGIHDKGLDEKAI